MALPTNDHHVHSDGYTSERGEPDQDRMLREMADDLEECDGVENVWPEADYVDVECSGPTDELYDIADEWGCVVQGDGRYFEIRPE